MADHPQECLSCARNGSCEFQTLAKVYGEPFSSNDHAIQHDSDTHVTDMRLPESSGETLIRDMRKCVKCGRCVDVCQNVQAVRAINTASRSIHYEICTPYKQALEDGPCVYCGLCAQVCPVGAIVEYDQSAEVLAALNSGRRLIATVTASICADLDAEFGLPQGTITKGKIAAVLKLMGFQMVFDAASFADQFICERASELLDRIKNSKMPGKNLPMIISCSPAVYNFVEAFYPELKTHLPADNSPEQRFGALVKTWYNKTFNVDMPEIMYVSIMPCIAKKHEAHKFAKQSGNEKDGFCSVDFALSGRELARMIRAAGIDLNNLPEASFDSMADIDAEKNGQEDPSATNAEIQAILAKVFEAYTADQKSGEINSMEAVGITETELNIQGKIVKILTVNGLANAHTIMDSIRKGECNAALVCVMSCTLGCGSQVSHDIQ
jgi:NADH-quinone oxidoreductase subunit G/NADP-reducing hydrogenase subunit HndD